MVILSSVFTAANFNIAKSLESVVILSVTIW